MPPKRNPLGQPPARTRSANTIARFSSRRAGLSLAPTGRPRVWESKGPPCISECRSLAFRVPTGIHFPRSRVTIAGSDPPIDSHTPNIVTRPVSDHVPSIGSGLTHNQTSNHANLSACGAHVQRAAITHRALATSPSTFSHLRGDPLAIALLFL